MINNKITVLTQHIIAGVLSKLTARNLDDNLVAIINIDVKLNDIGSYDIKLRAMPCVALSVNQFEPSHVQCGISIEFLNCLYDTETKQYQWDSGHNFGCGEFYTNFLWGVKDRKSEYIEWNKGTNHDISQTDDKNIRQNLGQEFNDQVQSYQLKNIFSAIAKSAPIINLATLKVA